MPGSIHAAMFFNEPEPEGFWPFEEWDEDSDHSCDPVANGWITAEEADEIAEQIYFESRVQELKRKWNAWALPHHAYAPKWVYTLPDDDDIPF